MPRDSVRRKIVYYGSRVSRSHDAPPSDYGHRLRAAVRAFDRANDAHLLEVGDDTYLAAYGQTRQAMPCLQLGLVRRTDLPVVQAGDEIRDLGLAQDEGLMELAHFMFFPDGVIGAEYNYRGPKASTIPRYIREMCPDLEQILVGPLVSQSAAERLLQMNALTLIEIEISRANAAILREAEVGANSFYDLVDAASETFGGEYVRLSIGREPRTDQTLRTGRLAFLRRLFRDQRLAQAADLFRVHGVDPDSGQEIMIDLLSQHIVGEATVAKVGRNKVVSASDMYDAIFDVYHTRRAEIDAARLLWVG